MRIASITLPNTDNNGMPVKTAHEFLRRSIMAGFGGGLTMVNVSGMWTNDAGTTFVDDSIRYEFVAEDLPVVRKRINDIATRAGGYASQEAVFVVYPDGEAAVI